MAVIESRWWAGYNSSVRGLFDLISDIHFETHHGYEYEMVSTFSALEESVKRLARSAGVDVLYLAMHGSARRLHLHGETVGPEQLGSALASARGRGVRGIEGLYLGACSFGTKRMAERLFEASPSLKWVAGYGAEVDFVNSGALDMLFFNDWLRRRGSAIEKVERVASHIRQSALGLCDSREIKFSIFARGEDGPVDLLRPAQ